MSELDTKAAFAGLRSAVRDSVTPPPAAGVRARAERQLRRRRTATAAVVVCAVITVLVGASTALRPTAAPPPPGQTPSPSVTEATPTPSSPPRPPLPEPRPILPVPEWPQSTIDDPIAQVDWRNVTLTLPAREGCPSGTLRFADGRTEGWPQMMLLLDGDLPGRRIAYGDVTGDGTAEAIIEAGCFLTQEADHLITALLVITRDGDGTLRAIGGWVGPGEWQVYRDIWVQDGRILTEQQWSSPGYEYAPGAAAAYQWDGDTFQPVASGLTPVVAIGGQTLGPPIDLGPDDGYIARALGCPGGTVQFGRLDADDGRRVSREGVVYELEYTAYQAYLADLASDGRRYVLVQILCREADVTPEEARYAGIGLRGQGLLVLDRTATGLVAVDLVTVPGGIVSGWALDEPGVLTAWTERYGTGVTEPTTWIWNGQYFQR